MWYEVKVEETVVAVTTLPGSNFEILNLKFSTNSNTLLLSRAKPVTRSSLLPSLFFCSLVITTPPVTRREVVGHKKGFTVSHVVSVLHRGLTECLTEDHNVSLKVTRRGHTECLTHNCHTKCLTVYHGATQGSHGVSHGVSHGGPHLKSH